MSSARKERKPLFDPAIGGGVCFSPEQDLSLRKKDAKIFCVDNVNLPAGGVDRTMARRDAPDGRYTGALEKGGPGKG